MSLLRSNFTAEDSPSKTSDFVTPILLNKTNTQQPDRFESDIEIVFCIFGVLSTVGTTMQIVSWLHSGCLWSHWVQEAEEGMKSPSLDSPKSKKSSCCYLLITSFLLCCISFIGYANEDNFASFGITFTVNSLVWSKADASNLVTVFWISVLVCRCVSIIFAKFFPANKIMICSTFIGLAGTLLMTSMISITPLSLWIGASLLGLGNGNTVANTLNAGKKLTSQTGIISSVIISCASAGRIVAPQIIGYLIDHVDPMWFLYLGVVYSGSMLLLSVAFQIVLLCHGKFSRSVVQQECDVPLDKIQTRGT